MAIRTEFTFFTLDVYHAIMMKIEPTDRLYIPSDNPYIHLKNYQVTYHDAKQGYTEVFQVRRVGFMYFCVVVLPDRRKKPSISHFSLGLCWTFLVIIASGDRSEFIIFFFKE